MRSLVVDASVGLSLVRQEPWSARASAAVSERVGGRLLVPSHFWLEITNSLSRRHGYSGAEVLEAVYELDQFGFSTVELGRPLLVLTIDIIQRHGLSSYDAAYLSLALSADAEIATVDRKLALAAGDRAVLVGQDGLAEGRAAYHAREVSWPEWPAVGAYLAELRADADRAMREEQTGRT